MRDSWNQQLVVKLDYDGDENVEIKQSEVDVSENITWNFRTESVVISAGKQTDGEKLIIEEFIATPSLK